MKKIILIVSLSLISTLAFAAKLEIRCLGPFHLESTEYRSESYPPIKSPEQGLIKVAGKIEVGIVYRPAKGWEVVAYSLLKPNNPMLSALKKDSGNMSLCFHKETYDEILKESKCETCTARGELQKKVEIYSVSNFKKSNSDAEFRK